MKRNWEYKKLGDVVSFIGDGDWIESRHQSDNGIRLIQTGNIGNGVFKAKEDRPHFISESTFDELGCTEIYEGDCLVSRLPDPIGRACIIPNMQNRMITAVDCSILRFQKLISSNFFVYYTRSKRYNKEIENYTTGSTRKRISRRNLESVQVPVPPLEEQSRIVAELDLLTGIIDKQNAQLKELDNLAQSIFYDLFGDPIENPKKWPVKKLGELSSLITNGNTPKGGEQVYVDKGILFLRSQNVWKNYIDYDDVAYIDDATNAILKKSVLHHNDILITKTGRINTENSSLGRSALFDGETGTANINGHVYLVRLLKGISHTFVLRILISKAYREYIRKVCVGGIDKRQINKDHVEDFPIIVPPLPLQQSFAEKIQSIEKQKDAIRASIADTQKLLDYTMDKYFG